MVFMGSFGAGGGGGGGAISGGVDGVILVAFLGIFGAGMLTVRGFLPALAPLALARAGFFTDFLAAFLPADLRAMVFLAPAFFFFLAITISPWRSLQNTYQV